MSRTDGLRITEIFHSLQGESTFVGLPTVFVRLTGCPLRCQYCDTAYAFSGGTVRSIEAILDDIAQYQCKRVCVSGGEPLAQPHCIGLMKALCDKGFAVSIETSGARDIRPIDARVTVVMDIKTPGSKESERNLWENLDALKPHDQIKFVICDRFDFDWSVDVIKQHQLFERADVLFSPSWQQQDATELANWIIETRLPIRFQLQLHKLLWNDTPGH